MTPTTRPAEVTLPVTALAAVRQALEGAVGAEAAAEALRLAGHAAGDSLFRILVGETDAAQMPAERFWAGVARLFSSRGWGQLAFSQPHAGVGAFEAGDWAEAATATSQHPACHFTTGMIANLLGQVAGGDVAVLEVECRSRGDARCRFLFGSADAVDAVYHRVAAGDAADNAVAQLG